MEYGSGRLLFWGRVALLAVVAAVAVTELLTRPQQRGELRLIAGAVLTANRDLSEQRPIAEARIRAVAGESSGSGLSDQSGLFRLTIDPPLLPEQTITLNVEHPDYHPFEETGVPANQLHLVRLTPNRIEAKSVAEAPGVAIANIRVRYAFRAETIIEIGSAARTFEIANTPNTPCNNLPPCSPDGRWKATVGRFSLDAGENKLFRNARVSCLGGPCPFTRVESDEFSRGGRVIAVSVLNWADTVTYVVEAEVAQRTASDLVRQSYPVIFNRSMNFTLPPLAQGPSIEAEVNGEPIVFPLGPQLRLSWATCRLDTGADGTRLYRCELKGGYLFKP
jgi:hypothetical protein